MQRPEGPPPSQGSIWPIIMAGMLAMALFVGLFFLTLGAAGLIALIGAGVFLFTLFHYLVWGWWLGGMIREEVEDEEQADRVLP